MGKHIRVMVVDDNASVRRGLKTFLKTLDDVKLVAEATNGIEAIQLCKKKQPEVVLMDLEMPEMDGVAATQAIHQLSPHIHIIALSSFNESERAKAVLEAGAVTFLLKNVPANVVADTIRQVSSRSIDI